MNDAADIVVIGAGAAGLMSAIWAGRTARGGEPDSQRRIVVVDGAKHIGAKILVAGGGRCNVTHDVVDERAYAGSSRNAIKKVLKRFDVPATIDFFRGLGVELKREDTGKMFPVTDDARTVLDALLFAAKDVGVELRHPWRVEQIVPPSLEGRWTGGGSGATTGTHAPSFQLTSRTGEHLSAHRIILATGGKSLPKSGSDGAGYDLARALGHSITSRVLPALVPLTLPKEHPLCALSGISAIANLEVRSGTGKRLESFTDSTLCTHFGLSGPGPLDVSRYFINARMDDPESQLIANWLPDVTTEQFDQALLDQTRAKHPVSPGRFLREHGLPARFAETLCAMSGLDPSSPLTQLTREQRRLLVMNATAMPLPITGDRGFAHAEVTAGGVPLSEIRLETMESRMTPGLHIVGEICDVDGRIGGYNFQWAWSSGYIAGNAAAGDCSRAPNA